MTKLTYSRKATARARWKREVGDVIEERAVSCIQKFYLNRSVKYERLLSSKGYYVNPPLAYNRISDEITAKYQKISKLIPMKNFHNVFHTQRTKGNNTREKIKSLSFLLSAWPKSFHNILKCTVEYNTYRIRFSKHSFNEYVFEHGDFRPNNILKVQGKSSPLILDLEFARPYQPLGFDEFDFKRYPLLSPNYLLNRAKYKFVNKANHIVDYQGIIKIKINSKNIKNILNLYKEIYGKDKRRYYNLDLRWQLNWIRSFNPKRLIAYILVKDNEPKAMCLFHSVLSKRGKFISRPIGQAPDCEDYFALPAVSRDMELKMVNLLMSQKTDNIMITNFPLYENEDIRFSNLAKCIDSVLNFEYADFSLKKKKKNEINRLKNNLFRDYGIEYSNLQNNVDNDSFESFYEIWLHRWGFDENAKKAYRKFYQLNIKSKLMELHTLKDPVSNMVLAYQFCYKEENGLVSHIPVINQKFMSVSPGRILLFKMLIENPKSFSFGRGRETYKQWFSTSEQPIYELSSF